MIFVVIAMLSVADDRIKPGTRRGRWRIAVYPDDRRTDDLLFITD